MTETLFVSGYAAVFGRPDLSGDIIFPGAFRKSLRNQEKLIPAPVSGVRMLYQHAADRPVGRWERLSEDRHGLLARGEIFLDTDDGRNVASLLRRGAIDGLSIGFKPVRSRPRRGGGRDLLEVALWEISIVTFPMHANARVTSLDEARAPRNLLLSN